MNDTGYTGDESQNMTLKFNLNQQNEDVEPTERNSNYRPAFNNSHMKPDNYRFKAYQDNSDTER